MAMAPSLRVGGRIVSSLFGVSSSRNPSGRATALAIVACRGKFTASAQRNAKGSAAAAWEESAELYFGSKDPESKPQSEALAQPESPEPPEEQPRRKSRMNSLIAARRGREERLDSPRGRRRISPRFSRINSEQHQQEDEEEEGEEDKDGWGVAVRYTSQNQVSNEEEDEDLIDQDSPRRDLRGPRRFNPRHEAMRYYDPREHERPSEVPRLHGEALYGVGPIRAALQARRRDLYVLYVQQGLDEEHSGRRRRKDPGDVVWILNRAKRLELRIESVSKHVLNMLVDNRPHQGFVLDSSSLEMVDISSLEDPGKVYDKAPVWVALDEVKDPQNFGAILRTCLFFGVNGVVVCAKNSAPLSGVVSKASAGALELIDLLSCKNMMMFLRDSADNGWRILGTSNTSESVLLSDLPKNLPTILVLGNEGVGVRPFVKAACDFMVRVPGALPLRRPRGDQELVRGKQDGEEEDGEVDDQIEADPSLKLKSIVRSELIKLNAEVDCFLRPGTVDSLNVSVAAGVLINGLVNFTPDENVKSLTP